MSTRFGITVITSSLFDNENIILSTIIKFNEVTGVLINLKQSESFSKELNEKLERIQSVFIKNKKIEDIIKVLKISTKDKLAIFDKNFFLPSSNITKTQMIEYVKKEVFKSIITVDVTEKKVDVPDIQFVAEETLEKLVEEPLVEETTDEEVNDLLDSIPDEPIDGDKDLEEDEDFDEIKEQTE
jgi:hypothetical protein